MAVNRPATSATQTITTGGSNSAAQALAAATTSIRRLLGITTMNAGTNTGTVRIFAGTASTGTLLAASRFTTGIYASQHFDFGERGRDVSAGLYILGTVGTLKVTYSYITE